MCSVSFACPSGRSAATDLLYVYEERGRLAGLARVEREGIRDEWTIVELDAIDNGTAGDIRFRLVQHILRDAGKRGALRFHVACADKSGNVELFMQAGSHATARRTSSTDRPRSRLFGSRRREAQQSAASGPLRRSTRYELDKLYRSATPTPVARLEDYRQHRLGAPGQRTGAFHARR